MKPPSKGPLRDEASAVIAKKLEDEKRQRYDTDLKAVMRSDVGRRFVWRLLDDTTGLLASSFTGNSETFWREGRRSVGIFLTNEVRRVAPSEFVLMWQEQLTAQANEDLRRKEGAQATEE